MKKYFILLLTVIVISKTLPAQILNSVNDALMPTESSVVQSLNGEWKFKFLNQSDWTGDKNFYCLDYSDASWEHIAVPGCWDALGYVEPQYGNPSDMNGLYRKYFSIPSQWKGNHVFLRLDGVLRGYEVWLNGKYVGKWESSYNSCQFDITSYLNEGQNLLAIRVYIHYKGFDFDGNDDWGQVGINRNVSLFAIPDVHIKDFTMRTTQVSEESAKVTMDFDVSSFTRQIPSGSFIKGKIIDPQGRQVAQFKESIQKDSSTLRKEIILSNPMLWNAENPNLYQVDYALCTPKQTQVFKDRFGIREITIEKNVILLNGKKIKFRGVNLHETDPFNGKVVNEQLNLKDLRMMKNANINCIRCSHYPRDPRFYELCDSMGFYVISEVPFGYGDSNLYDKSFQDILLTRADATVQRDKNHPCILIWSIGNENPLTSIAEETGRYVKRMDPTRPICYPMIHNYFLSLDFELPDFIDVFAPHYPPVATLRYYADAAKRPVLLTEYCHSLGQSLEEHKELWELIEQNDNLAGGCVWEWVDQGMVSHKSTFPGKYAETDQAWLKDSTCITLQGNAGADGLIYANRVPLSNYFELRKNYAQVPVYTSHITAVQGHNQCTIELGNRYDFVNLADKVNLTWSLVDGSEIIKNQEVSLSCPAHCKTNLTLEFSLPENPTNKYYHIELSLTSKEGYSIGNYSIPIRSSNEHFAQPLFEMAKEEVSSMDEYKLNQQINEWFQMAPLFRVGRKFSMSEKLKAKGRAINHYLIEPEIIKAEVGENKLHQSVTFTNKEMNANGELTYEVLSNGGIRIHYAFSQMTKGKLLLEGGFAVLLNPKYEKVQWLGYGPFSSYPGKQSANQYGLHTQNVGDLYFEGNRMNIDAVTCTDSIGNGFLLIDPHCNVNFEQTDKGIVLSLNTVVSGLCGKLRKTSFPIYTDDVSQLEGNFCVFPLTAGQWPKYISYLFEQLKKQEGSENPFLTEYDTYLLRFEDIVE